MMPASNSNLCHDGNGLQLYLISSIPDTKKKQSFMSSRKKLDLLPQLEKILILGIKMWKLPKKINRSSVDLVYQWVERRGHL